MHMSALRRCFSQLVLCAVFVLLTASAGPAQAVPTSETDSLDGVDLELSVGKPAKDALLTILYDASTYGEMNPCPT